ncbi:MAG: hypothetical protein Q7R41_18245 [Phycisphaerales bacterium]|nr:hypothetical protein [Phycisphaerales bacterium]
MAFITLVITILFFLAVYLYQRRRKTQHDAIAGTMTVFAQAPTTPTQPATAWMFPGRGAPADPDPRPTHPGMIDKRTPPELPPSIRRRTD